MRSRLARRACCSILGPSPRRFFFSLSVCGIVISKFVHLEANLVYETGSLGCFFLFLPTFFIKDGVVISLIAYSLFDISLSNIFFKDSEFNDKSALYFPESTVWPREIRGSKQHSILLRHGRRVFQYFFGTILPVVIWITSSCELSYYLNTHQLVDWTLAGRIILDFSNFFGVLTGTGGNEISLAVLIGQLIAARFERPLTDSMLRSFDLQQRWSSASAQSQPISSGFVDEKQLIASEVREMKGRPLQLHLARFIVLISATGSILALSTCRPELRFDMSVNSLPAALTDCFDGLFQQKSSLLDGTGFLGFPYPELIQLTAGSKEHRDSEWLTNQYMPSPPPPGFEYWDRDITEEWKRFGQKALLGSSPQGADGNGTILTPPQGYHHAFNPLKFSNLHKNIHPPLKQGFDLEPVASSNHRVSLPLDRVKIRNVIFIQLESTRYDMYPLYKGTNYAQHAEKFRVKDESYADLDSVTPFARKLFGETPGKGGMGGLVMHGTESFCALTQKSIISSTCGTSPLALAWFQEANGQCYQPCFPHVFKLLNREAHKDGDWRAAEWDASWLQTATTTFDRQLQQFKDMGFSEEDGTLVTKEVMESVNGKFPEVIKNQSYVNWMGYTDELLLPYFREKIRMSKKENKRLFMGHITTTSHLPWSLPKNWKQWTYTELHYRNKYFNAMAYNDHWVRMLFELLDEEGIRNETLVVVAGDHGMSAGDDNKGPDGSWNPIPNPWVNLFRIPLIFHHPHMPPFHLHANASNRDILPTVFDLLLSSDSLPHNSRTRQRRILESLLPTYEGQSLIRERVYRNKLGLENYNIHLVSPGGEILVVSSTDPENPFRLRVPLNGRRQYGLANLREDPDEQNVLRAWTADTFFEEVATRWGEEAREWAEMADTISRWQIEENKRRWGMFESKKRFTEFGGFHG